jgi:DNA-binding NarL/FixJ family response regulator
VHAEKPSTREAVRIGIVDDDRATSAAIAAALTHSGRYQVLGCAASLREGLELATQNPECLLVDLGLPDGSGLSLIEHARALTLVFSMFGDAASVIRAIEYGAQGYILKTCDMAQVVAALDAVMAGESPISPAIASHLLKRVRGLDEARSSSAPSICLTAKERAILDALARGLSFKQVAIEQTISQHTVGDHVKAIYRKLAVSSRGEAVYAGIKSGLIQVRN